MQKIISLVTRKVPRKYLNGLNFLAGHVLALFYRGDKYECPIEGKTYRKFLPYGRMKSRPNALCPGSLSLERHRLQWLFMKNETNFFTENLRLLHIAPEMCFMRVFKKLDNINYVTADLDSPLADVKADVMDLPFDGTSFDVVFCNHVMEHVDDDIKAMKEIYRVLKPGGWAFMQVPLDPELEHTLEDPGVTDPAERERLYDQSDHMRKYGRDYGDRLRKAGFSVTEADYTTDLGPEKVERYALMPGEILYFCEKKSTTKRSNQE